MKTIFRYIQLFLLALAVFSCEDEINPSINNGDPVTTVDAFINNKPETQRISFTSSLDLFDNTNLPAPKTGAEVFIVDNEGARFDFVEGDPGVYEWGPEEGNTFGIVGNSYTLTINHEGVTYTSFSQMNPVPEIDSVFFTFEEGIFGAEDFFIGDFFARDLPELGNTYWFKSYKNGQLLNRVSEINIAYDAAFSPGGGQDQNGAPFIPPIRFAVNPLDDEGNFEEFPFVNNDSLYVEVHSITLETFTFLTELAVQGNRPGGLPELFAEPLNNVRTNVSASNEELVVGFFNVAAVKGNGRRLVESEIPKE